MNFEKYRLEFLKQALEDGYQRSEVDSLLVYAKVLFDKTYLLYMIRNTFLYYWDMTMTI